MSSTGRLLRVDPAMLAGLLQPPVEPTDLRSILNVGYGRGATVLRVVGQGTKMETKEFQTFAPVCLAGIGRLPDTIEGRSIVIAMRRRRADAKAENVERWRMRDGGAYAEPIRGRIAAWATANVDALHTARPDIPDALSDRAQDIWEPLLAIADAAGGAWPGRARDAAVALAAATETDELPQSARLLVDCRRIYNAGDGREWMSTAALVSALRAMPEAEWADMGQGRPIADHKLGRALTGYGIPIVQHQPTGGNRSWGRFRAAFEETWAQYLPPFDPADRLDEIPGRPSPFLASTTAAPRALRSTPPRHLRRYVPVTDTAQDTMTLGQLKAHLASLDIPDDALVLMEVDSYDDPRDTMEVEVSRVVASRGYGEASRVVFARQ